MTHDKETKQKDSIKAVNLFHNAAEATPLGELPNIFAIHTRLLKMP